MIVYIDYNNGYTCPDQKVEDYVLDAIAYAKKQDTDYTVYIGSDILFARFRLSTLRKDHEISYEFEDGPIDVNEWGMTPGLQYGLPCIPVNIVEAILTEGIKERVELRRQASIKQLEKENAN